MLVHTSPVFSFRPASRSEVDRQIAEAGTLPVACPRILAPMKGLDSPPPAGFAHDHTRTQIGKGRAAFQTAKYSFANWKMFDLGWAHIANPEARIEVGSVIAMEPRTLGLWTFNLSRIVEVIDLSDRFGFIYATTKCHVECGEERFLIEYHSATQQVWYDLEAISRPVHLFARIGLPISRAFQHKFARDSHRRMRELIT